MFKSYHYNLSLPSQARVVGISSLAEDVDSAGWNNTEIILLKPNQSPTMKD